MGLTQRFGFTQFDSPTEGSISEDGNKFTGRDRRVIDRILSALESHDHLGGSRLEEPAQAPTLELLEGQGNLPAGETLHYRVAYVDRYGLETEASAEASVATPDPVAVPDVPFLNAQTGGSLADGLYAYALTAMDDQGEETPLGPSSNITLTDRNTVEVSVNAADVPAGAEGLWFWRMGPLDSDFQRVDVLNADNSWTFVDDGTTSGLSQESQDWLESVGGSVVYDDPPPTENTTGSHSSVKVSIPFADVEIPTLVKRWRIYRTAESGVYAGDSLVHEVVETETEGGDQLVSEYTDTGGDLLPGHPLSRTQTLQPTGRLDTGERASTAVLVDDVDGTVRRVVATDDGALATKLSGMDAIFGVVILGSPGGGYYRVTTDTVGALETELVDPDNIDNALVYEHQHGPLLRTSDPHIDWMLTVEDGGTLLTVEV